MLKTLAQASLIAAAMAAAPAIAGTPQPWLTMTESGDDISASVSYADLDLKSPVGAQALHQRMSYASNEICSVANDDGMRRTNFLIATRNCGADLVAATEPQVRNVLRRARVQVEVTSLIISFAR